jgi:hypothetical protein
MVLSYNYHGAWGLSWLGTSKIAEDRVTNEGNRPVQKYDSNVEFKCTGWEENNVEDEEINHDSYLPKNWTIIHSQLSLMSTTLVNPAAPIWPSQLREE